MVVMYSFCFFCSIRLGSIVVGGFSLCQSMVMAILSLIWLNRDSLEISSHITSLLQDSHFLYVTGLMKSVASNPGAYLWSILTFSIAHILCSTSLIIGAFKCTADTLVPFLLAEMVRLLMLLFAHVTGMILIKENIQDLGLLILSTLAGSFSLLYLFYTWFCVLSLRQCLKNMRNKRGKKNPFMVAPFNETRGPLAILPGYQNNFNYSNLARPTY